LIFFPRAKTDPALKFMDSGLLFAKDRGQPGRQAAQGS